MKKIISLILSIVLCVSLIPAQSYVTLASTNEDGDVFVAGTCIDGGGYWVNDGKGGITQEGASENNYNLYYNGFYVFKLRNLDISNVYQTEHGYHQLLCNFGIYIAINGVSTTYTFTFELEGNNVINTIAQSAGNNYGIFSGSALKFIGNGTLTCSSGRITGENKNTYSYGIYSNGVEVIDTTVQTYSADVEGNQVGSFGIYSSKDIVIDNGILQTQSGNVIDSSGYMNSIGAIVSNKLEVKNSGRIEAKAGTSTMGSGDSIGIQATSVVLNGGMVRAVSSEARYYAFGFYATDIMVNEGQLIATGGLSQSNDSYGIRGDVNLAGGSIVASGNNGAIRNNLNVPEIYWWRTNSEEEYQSNSKLEYANGMGLTYIDITAERPAWAIGFNANGGQFADESTTKKLQTGNDGTIKDFPNEPTRTGYLFKGWYSAASSGTKIDESQVYEENTTVYAQWSLLTKPSTMYIGDVRITAEGYWLNDGNGSLTTTGADAENYNVYYDGSGTIYLNNLKTTTNHSGYGIYIFQWLFSNDCFRREQNRCFRRRNKF